MPIKIICYNNVTGLHTIYYKEGKLLPNTPFLIKRERKGRGREKTQWEGGEGKIEAHCHCLY